MTKTWLTDFLLLTVIIGIVFGSFLGSRPLAVPDEARYAEIPREMVVSGDYVTPRVNAIKYFEKPPFFYWLQAGAIKLFGLSEWSVRLITALMGLLGCLVTYYAGRQLFDRLTGWLASLLLATSALYFVMARFITLDMTVTALLTGCLFSFILGTRKPPGKERNFYMWSMYVFSALATLTKGLIGIVFPGAIIFIWMLIFNDWRNLKTYCLPVGILLWLIIVLPWHILVQLRNPEFFHFYIIEQHFERYLTEYANRDQPLWYLPAFFIAGFFPWIIFLLQALKFHWPQSWRQRYKYKEAIFLLIWPVFIYLFFSFSRSQLPPYVLPTFPPLAVLIGHYLASCWQKHHQKGISWGLLIFSIISLIGLVTVIPLAKYNDIVITAPIIFSVILGFLGVVVPLLSYRSYGVKGGLIALFIIFSLFLMSLTSSLLPFEQKSIKSLITQIKPHLKPDSVIISFHGYYQDLPFYLQRRVIIAGWGNTELDFGVKHQDMTGWFLTDEAFWEQWQSSRQVYVFLTQNDYNTLLKNIPGLKVCLIGTTSRNVLITNHC